MTSNVSGTGFRGAGREAESPWAASWTVAAAFLMVFGGVMAIFEGIAAIARDDVFVATPNFTYEFSLTGWGWVHLILGAAMVALGLVLFTGAAWARWTASVLVVLNLVAQFVSLPITPWWSLAVIVLDVVVLWALIVHGEEVERAVS